MCGVALSKLKQYTNDLHICGDRNSYSKTDHDAAFMHMKEDHMWNGQLKPGYNVNTATCNGFIIGNYVSTDRNDVHTLISFMEELNTTMKDTGSGKRWWTRAMRVKKTTAGQCV